MSEEKTTYKSYPSTHAKGRYGGTITGQRFGKANSGTKFFEVDVNITKQIPTEGDVKILPKPFSRSITIYLTDETIAKGGALEQLRACGPKCSNFKQLEPSHPEHESLKGNEVILYHDGKEAYRGWRINTGSNFTKPESDASVADELDDIFGKQFSETDLSVSVATTTAPAGKKEEKSESSNPDHTDSEAYNPLEDEDCPF